MLAHEIASLPSASILESIRRRSGERRAAPRTIMVFADPVFGPDDERLDTRPTASLPAGVPPQQHADVLLPRLRYTTKEAHTVDRLVPLPQQHLAVGFAATRALAMSPQVAQYRIIHFATHAVLDSGDAARSGIVLPA